MSKISVIGAGNVGATTVYYLAKENFADIVMVDIMKGLPQSRALDYLHASPLSNYNIRITGTEGYEEIKNSHVIVLTAGIARTPGMDRMDLLKTNVTIAKSASQGIAKYAPNAVVLAVTNPLDVIAMVVLRETGFDPNRVMGMAGVLDATRFCYFIAEELNVWPGNVSAIVLGGHGDTMVPVPRYTSVGGFPITELLEKDTIERLVERTRKGGAEIIGHLKKGSAYYAPGASAAKMVAAILRGDRRFTPVSAHLQGEYGYEGIFLGVPTIIGKGGVEKIIELDLSDEEREALDNSARAVQEGVKTLESFYAPG